MTQTVNLAVSEKKTKQQDYIKYNGLIVMCREHLLEYVVRYFGKLLSGKSHF